MCAPVRGRENQIICGLMQFSTSTDDNPEVYVDLNISLFVTGMPVVISVSPDR